MKSDSQKQVTPKTILGQNSGQLVVEYILLLVLTVSIATLLTSILIGKGDERSGFVMVSWSQMLQMVGNDLGD